MHLFCLWNHHQQLVNYFKVQCCIRVTRSCFCPQRFGIGTAFNLKFEARILLLCLNTTFPVPSLTPADDRLQWRLWTATEQRDSQCTGCIVLQEVTDSVTHAHAEEAGEFTALLYRRVLNIRPSPGGRILGFCKQNIRPVSHS